MRPSVFALPFAFVSAAAAAAPQQPLPIEVPAELADPATAEKLANMMDALSRSFLAMPIGEVQAASEGRTPTAEEKGLTIGELGRRDDSDFDRKFAGDMARTRPMIEQSMKALSRALPAMTRALTEAAVQLENVAAEMPDPEQPRR